MRLLTFYFGALLALAGALPAPPDGTPDRLDWTKKSGRWALPALVPHADPSVNDVSTDLETQLPDSHEEGLTVQKFLDSFQRLTRTDDGFVRRRMSKLGARPTSRSLQKLGSTPDLALFAESDGENRRTAVFLLPTADVDDAFGLDTEAAHHLRFLVHYDVYVFRVSSIDEAQQAITDVVADGNKRFPQNFVGVDHLDIGGHGTGPTLEFAEGSGQRSLRMDAPRSEEFFEWLVRPTTTGAPLAPRATIFLNSCHAGNAFSRYESEAVNGAFKQRSLLTFAAVHACDHEITSGYTAILTGNIFDHFDETKRWTGVVRERHAEESGKWKVGRFTSDAVLYQDYQSSPFNSETTRYMVSCELTKPKASRVTDPAYWTYTYNFPETTRMFLQMGMFPFDSKDMLDNGETAFGGKFRVYYGTWCDAYSGEQYTAAVLADVSLEECELACEKKDKCVAFTHVRRLAVNTDLKVSEGSLPYSLSLKEAMYLNARYKKGRVRNGPALAAVAQCHLSEECGLLGDPPALEAALNNDDTIGTSVQVTESSSTSSETCLRILEGEYEDADDFAHIHIEIFSLTVAEASERLLQECALSRRHVKKRNAHHFEVVRALLDRVSNVLPTDVEGRSPLMLASRAGRLDVICALLAAGADVNERDSGGMTALMLATYAMSIRESDPWTKDQQFDLIKELLQRGADANACNRGGTTALMCAVKLSSDRSPTGMRMLGVVKELLQNGADINARGTAAVDKSGHVTTSRKEAGVPNSLFISDKDGVTALALAIEESLDLEEKRGWGKSDDTANSLAVLNELLQNGADVRMLDQNGRKTLERFHMENKEILGSKQRFNDRVPGILAALEGAADLERTGEAQAWKGRIFTTFVKTRVV